VTALQLYHSGKWWDVSLHRCVCVCVCGVCVCVCVCVCALACMPARQPAFPSLEVYLSRSISLATLVCLSLAGPTLIESVLYQYDGECIVCSSLVS